MSAEVGYVEARRMPTEVRRWWIGEMNKEREARDKEIERQRTGRTSRNV